MTAVAAAMVAGGCAAAGSATPEPGLAAVETAEAALANAISDIRVPALVGRTVELVEKEAFAAGVVPVLDYQVAGDRPPGTVISVEPAAGSAVPFGSVVTVRVAGAAGPTLDDQVRAARRLFVGVAAEPDGTLVLALAGKVNRMKALDTVRPFLAGRSYRVVECATSWVALEQLRLQLARRDFLPPGDQRAFAASLDPARCAIRLQAEFTEAEAAELRDRFGRMIIVERGEAARAPRR
ncbi:MAG TPA: PASTA domain-containing protein [Micromonosporaceae bacterium]|nr:PASTA domain-containing protein [Micromonosporaceae bacterium]